MHLHHVRSSRSAHGKPRRRDHQITLLKHSVAQGGHDGGVKGLFDGGSLPAEKRIDSPYQGKLSPGAFARSSPYDGAFRAVFAHHGAGTAAFGEREHRLGVKLPGDMSSRMAYGIRHRGGINGKGGLPLPPGMFLFNPPHDLAHGTHGLHGIFPLGGFSRKHHRIRSIQHRIGHVVCLRPGGTGIPYHGIQHLGSHDDGLPLRTTDIDNALLLQRHILRGNFHSQIAPGHHHAVHYLGDLFQGLHGLLGFDLGDDLHGMPAAELLHNPQHFQHVVPAAYEGHRDILHFVLQAPADILSVLFREGGHRKRCVGDVDPLALSQFPSHHDPAENILSPDLLHLKLKGAVVDKNIHSGGNLPGKLRITQGDLSRRAFHGSGGKTENLAVFQVYRLVSLEKSRTDFGALGIQQGRQGTLSLLFHPAHELQISGMSLVLSVTEVEPGHVHSLLRHGTKGFEGTAGGAQGTYYFYLSHESSPPLSITPCFVYILARPRIFTAEECSVN